LLAAEPREEVGITLFLSRLKSVVPPELSGNVFDVAAIKQDHSNLLIEACLIVDKLTDGGCFAGSAETRSRGLITFIPLTIEGRANNQHLISFYYLALRPCGPPLRRPAGQHVAIDDHVHIIMSELIGQRPYTVTVVSVVVTVANENSFHNGVSYFELVLCPTIPC
jgi:hypothetical protein